MKERILIVDDDTGIREILSSFVSELGYEAVTAEDGLVALDRLGDGSFLCVFTDIMMPNLTGIELIKKIKAKEINLPVIVVTGYASLETAVEAMKHGAYDIILKPFKLNHIEKILNKIVMEKQLLTESSIAHSDRQLYNLINDLSGQIEDKSNEIHSLQIISDRITRIKSIKDLVGAAVDVTKELFSDSNVGFYLYDRMYKKLVSPLDGSEIPFDDRIYNGEKLVDEILDSDGKPCLEYIFPLVIEEDIYGIMRIIKYKVMSADEEDKVSYVIQRMAERMENVVLLSSLYDNVIATLNSMAIIIDAKDPMTASHSRRVRLLAMLIGKLIDLNQEDIELLDNAASMHDIGKVGIRDNILLKDELLTNEEYSEIKKHPGIGYDILKRIPPLNRESKIIRHHHERYDGKGYPDGLKGEDIPLLSRIITLADSFDAMISLRLYRKGISVGSAFDEIVKCRGTQFDPKLVDVFIEHRELIDEMLNDNQYPRQDIKDTDTQ